MDFEQGTRKDRSKQKHVHTIRDDRLTILVSFNETSIYYHRWSRVTIDLLNVAIKKSKTEALCDKTRSKRMGGMWGHSMDTTLY